MKNQQNRTISANTKIGALLKQHPDALEAIISISPKFAKLRNPILRKVIAGRTSIAMASKLGGCTVDDFFNKLKPLGFEVDLVLAPANEDGNKQVPGFMKAIDPGKIVDLDVRPFIESGKDPLDIILKEIRILKPGHILKIINSFEPTPLILLLGKRGFESYTENINDDLVHTFFYKKGNNVIGDSQTGSGDVGSWEEILVRFKGNLETIDVRELEMPLPMHAILKAMENLPEGKALYVYHKRIPVFLLPEIEERQFSYRIKEISDSEVHLLIYKD